MTTLSPLLVDAKKEYTHQLADVLAPYVMNTVARIYETSKKKTAAFRELLRQVPNWNNSSIEERTNEIERRNPQLEDLIAACCVSYTKVLGSIRLNQSQNSNVRIALPQTTAFVHGVYIHVAKEFFYDPKLVYADRHAKILLLQDAVEESIRQHVPIRQLLKAYLSLAVDSDGMDPLAAAGGIPDDPIVVPRPGSPVYSQQDFMMPPPQMMSPQPPPMMPEFMLQQPQPHFQQQQQPQPHFQQQQQQPHFQEPQQELPQQPQPHFQEPQQELPQQPQQFQHQQQPQELPRLQFFEGAGDFD